MLYKAGEYFSILTVLSKSRLNIVFFVNIATAMEELAVKVTNVPTSLVFPEIRLRHIGQLSDILLYILIKRDDIYRYIIVGGVVC